MFSYLRSTSKSGLHYKLDYNTDSSTHSYILTVRQDTFVLDVRFWKISIEAACWWFRVTGFGRNTFKAIVCTVFCYC